MGLFPFIRLVFQRLGVQFQVRPWLGAAISICVCLFVGLPLLTGLHDTLHRLVWVLSTIGVVATFSGLVVEVFYLARLKAVFGPIEEQPLFELPPSRLLDLVQTHVLTLEKGLENLTRLASFQTDQLRALEYCTEGLLLEYAIDLQGKLQLRHLGDNFSRFFSIPKSELLQSPLKLLDDIDHQDREAVRHILLRLDAFPERERVVYGLSQSAHEQKRYLQLALYRKRVAIEQTVVVGLLTDVSEHILARQKAEADDRAKSDFLATVSHELRTPLNAIVGFSRLLETNLTDTELKSDARNVVAAGESLHMILNDILDYSRIEAQGVRLENKPFDLNDLLHGVYALNRNLAQQKSIEFTYKNQLEDYSPVLGDPFRLRQVIQNLVSNALKFTEQGYVHLKVSGSAPIGGRMEIFIEVADSGIGISKVHLAKLFQRFSQAGRDINRRFGGTGLGLAISKGLIELMGGRIDVTSEPGLGSVFTISLNMAVSRLSPTVAPQKTQDAQRPLLVLIVDDHPLNLKLLDKFLTRRGHGVVQATGGAEAVKLAEAQAFDLILMDIDMPEMDGHEACRLIRAGHGLSKSAYVCALSGLADEQSVSKSLSFGMNKHMTKPLSFEALDEVLVFISLQNQPADAGV